jgi:hypothetical protein
VVVAAVAGAVLGDTVGDNSTVVYDSGFSTLLQNQGSVLVHFNKDRTEQWMLVRLQPPKATAKTS